MDAAFRRAILNVVNHGDTDIFPYPVENRLFYDCQPAVIELLKHIDQNFDAYIISHPPANYGALAPVGYTGFRWATQIDPIWNIYFLSLVIKLGNQIEGVRLPIDTECVFSYRFNPTESDSDLFRREIGWRSFNEKALELGSQSKFVVSCDISEFYPRLNHHRLENSLRHIEKSDPYRQRIMDFLGNFSGTYSFGLPVGGPAARLLSELTLNQIDRLLYQKKVRFCRFADDFYLFSDTESDSFKNLVFISEILNRNQGLQLQKSKTRIMSSAEFVATNVLNANAKIDNQHGESGVKSHPSLFNISLHFDPYSSSANEDYERIKSEMRQFPIMDTIKYELSKSRVNVSLARKITGTLQFIEQPQLDDAARTLIENDQLLYPVYFNVLSAIKYSFQRLSLEMQDLIIEYVRNLIDSKSAIMSVDLNLQYAVRLLSTKRSEESVSLLSMLYDSSNSPAIRQDIIIAMARWKEWVWLSDRKAYFRTMLPAERRAFIMASYVLSDEGQHWRKHTKAEFSPFEIIVKNWMSERVSRRDWEIPL